MTQTVVPRRRAPWSLHLAAWCWIVAGIALAIAPVLAAVLLRSQYESLKRSGRRIVSGAELIDPTDTLDLMPYFDELGRFELWLADVSGWVLVALAVAYALVAVACLAAYVVLSVQTARGRNWARITATVLASLCTLVTFFVWSLILQLSWLPLTALNVNHLGLAAMLLSILGIVLAWLPASNRYAARRVQLE